MATFVNTLKPTPFGFFDADVDFQSEADNAVLYVKRRLGDDILSVELTKKQIWACFEESVLEYGYWINQYQARSQLHDFLGQDTSIDAEQTYPRETLEFLLRQAEPYAMEAGVGGSYNHVSGAIQLEEGRQDYDIYSELMTEPGGTIPVFTGSQPTNKSKLRIREVFHFSPNAAFRFFDSTSAINFLSNEFSFESFTPETIFYVLPVFEDILRAGQLDVSQRVRRSNYSYQIIGTKIRIFPLPTFQAGRPRYLWIRVSTAPNPLDPDYEDDTINGVSNIANIPFGNIDYTNINSLGRQWIRQYLLAIAMETLGRIRKKFDRIPIPNADLVLDGDTLLTQGRDDRDALRERLKEMLETLTYDKIAETRATMADNIQKQLAKIPFQKPISTG